MKKVILATALNEVVHNDPAAGSGNSNSLLFNRQKMLRVQEDVVLSEDFATSFSENYKVPDLLIPYFEDANIAEFASVLFIKKFIDCFNSAEGIGIFTGTDRYNKLISRAKNAAMKNSNLTEFWNSLVTDMKIEDLSPRESDIIDLISECKPFASALLTYLAKNIHAVILIVRKWKDIEIGEYTKKKKAKQNVENIFSGTTESEPEGIKYLAPKLNFIINALDEEVEIPAFQTNGIRHNLREAAFKHLCSIIGIKKAIVPGEGDLLPAVEALFWNGNSIESGAKASGNTFLLRGKVRKTFPTVDLFGGCFNGTDIGESKLKATNQLVCKENAEYAYKYGISSNIPANMLLTDLTHTRHASPQGIGQMIMNVEALAKGTQFIIEFNLDRFSSELTIGAFQCAFDYWIENNPCIGGMSRIGYGQLAIEVINDELPDCRQKYIEYLTTYAEDLKRDMKNGTLGAGQVVCS